MSLSFNFAEILHHVSECWRCRSYSLINVQSMNDSRSDALSSILFHVPNPKIIYFEVAVSVMTGLIGSARFLQSWSSSAFR